VRQTCKFVRQLVHDESGQDLIEYALAACLIACAAVASIRSLASSVTGAYTRINTSFNSAI
jgi:pilus assembly protein Flp/PilA